VIGDAGPWVKIGADDLPDEFIGEKEGTSIKIFCEVGDHGECWEFHALSS
jgi:hypothetical protein